jgi:hypothetical protein
MSANEEANDISNPFPHLLIAQFTDQRPVFNAGQV